jgi:hypothetical protein
MLLRAWRRIRIECVPPFFVNRGGQAAESFKVQVLRDTEAIGSFPFPVKGSGERLKSEFIG